MAEFVALDCRIEVDGMDLSDHCRQANFSVQRDMPEATTFGDEYKRFLPGLKDLTLGLNFNSDYAASSVDATLFPNWDDGSSVDVKLRPTSDSIATDNPEYVITSYIEGLTILNVTPGQIAENDVTFKNAASSISRNTGA